MREGGGSAVRGLGLEAHRRLSSVTFDTRDSPTRRGGVYGGWPASAGAACVRREAATRTNLPMCASAPRHAAVQPELACGQGERREQF